MKENTNPVEPAPLVLTRVEPSLAVGSVDYPPAVPSLPATVYVVSRADLGAYDAYTDRGQAVRAAQELARTDRAHGVITWTYDDADGASVHGPGPLVRVTPVPLHAPPHALPVVDQAAVTAALNDTVACDNCFGPGPLVPHVHGMRVCQRCFPEPDAFPAALDTQDGGAER